MEQKITAGRDELGGFAPKFAQLNDDVLFGEVWAREEALSARDRRIVTVTALMAGRPAYGEGGLRVLTAGGPGISLGLLPRHGHEMTARGPGPPTCAITSCA